MRGKYAARAAGARDRTEAEQDRKEAVLRAERAEKALREAEEKHARQRETYEHEIAALRSAAEESVAPVVTRQLAEIESLRVERDELQRKLAAWAKSREKFERALMVTLAQNFPIDAISARTLISQVWWQLADIEEPGALSIEDVAVPPKAKRGGNNLGGPTALLAVDKGRITTAQANVIAASRTGRPSVKANGDANFYGDLWTSEEAIRAEFDLGPLTRDVADAAAGDGR